MVGILDKKKVYIDIIIIIYIFIITFIGFFFSFSKFLSFSGGSVFGEITSGGLSVIQIANGSNSEVKNEFFILMGIIFLLIFVLLGLNMLYYAQLRMPKKEIIKSLLTIIFIGWILLILIFSILFGEATSSSDHLTLRVYSPQLFGVVGLLSYIILGIFECVWIYYSWNKTFASRLSSSEYERGIQKGALVTYKPQGVKLIALYEIIGGITLGIGAIFFWILSSAALAIGAGLTSIGGSRQTPTNPIAPIAALLLLLAIFSIFTGIELNSQKYIGYILSWIILIASAIILIFTLIIPLISILCIIYFVTNDEFEQYKQTISGKATTIR